mmetsp:Transcript_34135/g.95980  ORF Transcript_34135/g.95980 Transcript_34135/m.95980 type:complete len:211 (+) Transcript_34135:1331-1963(+)
MQLRNLRPRGGLPALVAHGHEERRRGRQRPQRHVLLVLRRVEVGDGHQHRSLPLLLAGRVEDLVRLDRHGEPLVHFPHHAVRVDHRLQRRQLAIPAEFEPDLPEERQRSFRRLERVPGLLLVEAYLREHAVRGGLAPLVLERLEDRQRLLRGPQRLVRLGERHVQVGEPAQRLRLLLLLLGPAEPVHLQLRRPYGLLGLPLRYVCAYDGI